MSDKISPDSEENPDNDRINEVLLRATIKLNTILLACVFGALSGLSLFAMTLLSIYRTPSHPGQYLNLLGVFLPGYEVSIIGAWIGLFWGALIGVIISVVIYRIYARTIRHQVQECLQGGRSMEGLDRTMLLIDGNSLGIALGAAVSLGLFVTTNWLVIRGTARESVNAALLSNYLPGYTVSFPGSIIGMVEIFIIVYLVCALLSLIYNRITTLRRSGARNG